MAKVGKNILDNLTTGMYKDSRVIYREYVQNACDQIDKAIEQGLLAKKEGLVDIYIAPSNRYISIRDNATGVVADSFRDDLGDIANSNKERGKNKGFRGIGRLCGIGYCGILKFTTSYKGENKKSIMTCDAKRMREMLVEKQKYSLDEIWDTNISYEVEPEDSNEHYFEVELIDIKSESIDLLDENKIREYLSFIAPVPYKNTFILRNQIYDYAKKNNRIIDEYCVKVNGAQVFKEYTTKLKEKPGTDLKNYDEISRLEFHDVKDDNGNLLAWMWVGLSRFEKQIPKINLMRGLRLRSANIQLGNDDVLTDLFKEPRGNYYFVGEVFAVNEDLIPNSQRDYFNENIMRVTFEDKLREYFYDVLHKLYYDANRIKNAYKRQEDYLSRVEEFKKKIKENGFVDEEEKQKMQYGIECAKKEAEEARKQLDKFDGVNDDSPLAEVHKSIGEKFDAEKLKVEVFEAEIPKDETDSKKKGYITTTMSKLSRSERKLVGKILTIITDIAPKEIAEKIIEKIKEEMK